MSFSVHRPGRFGSDGRIELDAPDEQDETEPLYLSDLQAADSSEVLEPDELPDEATRPPQSDPPAADEAPREGPSPSAAPERARPSEAPQDAGAQEGASVRRARRARPRMPWTRRLAVLGGADGDVLDEVPIETPRFVQMFFVLAGTALVSALSMFFALVTGVRVAAWIAVPIALVWSLVIFNLDRFLTSTMRATHSILKLAGLALPRVIMAAIIGIVVAEPLVLQVFHNDIAREVTSTNVVHALADQKGVADGPEKKALDAATTQVRDLENQAATGIVPGTSSTSAASVAAQRTVDALDDKLAAQQKVIDQARALYQCELTGQGSAAGCTGVAGQGASSTAAKDQLAAAQASYDALAAKLRDANAALAAADASGTAAVSASEAQNKKQAQDQLPAARQTYKDALAAYNARASSVAGGNAEAVGLLSQIGALDRLSQKEPVLAWAHWLIAALFFMIELLPVLVKVLTSYGEPSLYERADAMRRQVALDRVTTRSWNERADIVRGSVAGA